MTGPDISLESFLHTRLPHTAVPVFRLGLSGSFWPPAEVVREGIDAGMNYVFWFYWDRRTLCALREVLPAQREKLVIATGTSNLGPWLVRRALEGCLRKLRTDYIDVFHIFWVGRRGVGPRTLDLLQGMREQGKIRNLAISTHLRPYAGECLRKRAIDVAMVRYNAAHRGAETEVFPHLQGSDQAIVSYTATRWRTLLQSPRGWAEREGQPSAADCYRFVLTNPSVNVCLTAPRNRQQLRENLAGVNRGPLCEEEMSFIRRFGDAVHDRGGRFR